MSPIEVPGRPRVVWVRPVSESFPEALHDGAMPLDLAGARTQHAAYVAALADTGAQVVEVAGDDAHPDAVFIEDTVVMLGETAVCTRPGAPCRRGEVAAVAQALAPWCRVVELGGVGATLDGGDVLRAGEHVLVGRSSRSNEAGIAALSRHAGEAGLHVHAVSVRRGLHLKSAVCLAAAGLAVVDAAAVDPEAIEAVGIEVIEVEEPMGANVLWLGDRTLVSAAAPHTASVLRARGLRVETVAYDALHAADGGLTCCSVRLAHPGSWCT